MKPEERTARLTILIDPHQKAVFEKLCAAEDSTPSQIVRGLIRRYLEERLEEPSTPAGRQKPGAQRAVTPRARNRQPVRR